MDMRVMVEVLSPGVENRGQADVGAEVLRIAGDRGQRLGRGREQQAVHRHFILVGDGADDRRQREHDVEVGDRQQLGFARCQPVLSGPPLTLWTMAIAARIISDPGVRAVLAALDVTAECGRAAGFDRRHDATLAGADMPGIGVAPCLAVAAEDIRHLKVRSGHRRRVRPAASPPCSTDQAGSGSVGSC